MELVERDAELAALTEALDRAAQGHGAVVSITGDAGLGKTSLMRQFLEEAAPRADVRTGSCDDLMTARPLGPLRDMAGRADDPLGQALGDGTREQVFEAVLEAATKGRSPTVFAVEDVHWADDATIDVLRFLARRIVDLPALLVLTYRDAEVPLSDPLRFMLGDLPPAAHLRFPLAPLSQETVHRLADEAGQSGATVYRTTGGNPFFVTELLRTGGDDVPGSVRDAVMARVARLDEASRAAVEVLSVVPGRAEWSLLDACLGAGSSAFDEAERRGLIEMSEPGVAFRHELSRRAVEASLTTSSRRTLNWRVAQALLASGGDAVRIVHHAEQAGRIGDVLDSVLTAAREADARASHPESMSHYLRLEPYLEDCFDAESRATILGEMAWQGYLANRYAEGIAAAKRQVAIWHELERPLDEGKAYRVLSRLQWTMGDRKSAERAIERATPLLEPLGATSELAMAYSTRGQLAALAYAYEDAEHWSDRALEVAETVGARQPVMHTLNNKGVALTGRDYRGGLALVRQSLEMARQDGLADDIVRALVNSAWMALDHRDLVTAEPLVAEAVQFARDQQVIGFEMYAVTIRAWYNLARGEWDLAEADILLALAYPYEPVPALVFAAELQARRGQDAAKTTAAEAWESALCAVELQRTGPAAAAVAEAALMGGDAAAAQEILAEPHEQAAGMGHLWMAGELGLLLHRAGVDDLPVDRYAEPYALQIGGEWDPAAAAWDKLGYPFEAAVARLDSADEAALLAALETFDRLGAAPYAGMARDRLRELGATHIPRGASAATRANPAGLTPRQADVLSLLAEGLTNAEIAARLYISPKTVDHHVSAVLTRLGVSTRQEAAQLAASLGPG